MAQKVKQRFNLDDNLFAAMEIVDPTFPLKNVIDSDTINKLWIVHSGNKMINPIMDDMTTNEIAEILLGLFGGNWERIIKTFSKEFVTSYYQETYDESNTDKTENSNTENNKSANNISGYNDDELTPKDETVTSNTSTNSKNGSSSRNYTKKVEKGSDLKNTTYALDFLKRNNLCDIIIANIDNFLCLKVYDTEDY